jgi:methionyl-tRNA formyltransferase
VQINKNGIDVTCGDTKILRITKLQLPGKKPIRVTEMVNGNHPFTLNNRFI